VAQANALIEEFGSLRAVMTGRQRRQARILRDEDAIIVLALLRGLVRRAVKPDPHRPFWQQLPQMRALFSYEMGDLITEQVRVLYTDRRGALIRDEIAVTGTVDQTVLPIREIVLRTIELGASGLIVAHNHPSGDPTPSQADIRMTLKLVRAAACFDVAVHDHIVVGRSETRSIRQLQEW
jgi:DNA repair protein RadC